MILCAMKDLKPIRFTTHAHEQARLRGAADSEVTQTIRMGKWEPALRGKYQAKKHFSFDQESPLNQKHYRFKSIEAIFADEADAIVIITVKVYYSNEEQTE